MEHLSAITQIVVLLGTICHVVVGLRAEACAFIIHAAIMMVKLAMATGLAAQPELESKYSADQEFVLNQLPTSLFTALSKFNIDGDATLYAVCPSCNYTHQPSYDAISANLSYPSHCLNKLAGEDGFQTCGTALLENHNNQPRPIKPYLVSSFREYLVRLLANKSTEQLCDSACDNALTSLRDGDADMRNVFQGEFMRTFEGPVPGKLFIDRGDKVRLAFAMHVDFFNPNGVRVSANSDSIGVISLANLNLPACVRYRPENVFLVGIIPGPRKPVETEINHFIRPIIDEFEIGWERGFHISKTALSPVYGRDVEVAIVLSVNDLPAAREVSGSAGHTSHFICTRCELYNQRNIHNIDYEQWKLQDTALLRQKANEWKAAANLQMKKEIFAKNHVRWSEFWRLPYWDPPRMLVCDPMHCLLEGLVHYHCRRVLEIDAKRANEPDDIPDAFSYDWMPHSRLVPANFCVTKEVELLHIPRIQRLLTRPLAVGETGNSVQAKGTMNEPALRKRLLAANKMPLKFVCFSLGLPEITVPPRSQKNSSEVTKEDLVNSLIHWVCCNLLPTAM
jgi:hypothetical protein